MGTLQQSRGACNYPVAGTDALTPDEHVRPKHDRAVIVDNKLGHIFATKPSLWSYFNAKLMLDFPGCDFVDTAVPEISTLTTHHNTRGGQQQ